MSRAAALGAAIIGLGAAAITGARLLGGGSHTPLPQLAAMAFWAIPMWLLVATVLVLGRARLLLAVPLLALALHAWWLAPAVTGGPASGPLALSGTPTGHALRVLTFNARLGQADPAAIAQAARAQQVDVLVVVELTPQLDAELDRQLPERLRYNQRASGFGAYGGGIWSSLPLQPLEAVAGTSYAAPRARITLPGGADVTLTAVHPTSPRPGQVRLWRRDLALIAEVARAVPGPQIIAGDFNAGRDHAAFRRVLAAGLVDAADARGLAGWPGFTWPADTLLPPLTRIDHVLITPGPIEVRGARTIRLPGSDHLAVLAVLWVRG